MGGERDEGQAAVELALVLPLLVVLLLGVVQVTLIGRDQVLVVHAARAGARQAAVDPDPSAVRRAVLDAGGSLKERRLSVDTRYMGPGRDTVITRVQYVARTEVALIGPLLPDLLLDASAAMRSEMSGSSTLVPGTTGRQQEPASPGANPPIR